MSNEKDYGLLEPFDIDSGELDGLTPQHVFCLGYEWRHVQEMLNAGTPFHNPILHAANANRVKRMCIRRGRKFKVEATADTWCSISVTDEAGNWPEHAEA